MEIVMETNFFLSVITVIEMPSKYYFYCYTDVNTKVGLYSLICVTS